MWQNWHVMFPRINGGSTLGSKTSLEHLSGLAEKTRGKIVGHTWEGVKWVKLDSFHASDRKYLDLDRFLKFLSNTMYVAPAADFYLAAVANIGSHFCPKAAFSS